ncbi:MAG: hypothetical protein PHO26_04230 [Dehalococcoidia bacterium]|nr:hypothetical protein [Dehalococcoidia bacterium]MDD5493169.1 hypothetical protein [Dehalococcoidia bacterium]
MYLVIQLNITLLFNLTRAIHEKNWKDARSESGQINCIAFFLPLNHLTMSQDCYLILQFLRGKEEPAEKFYTGDFTSGFDEFINRPLLFSQTFRCFKSGSLSEALSRARCKRITSMNPIDYHNIAVFAKNLTFMHEAVVPGNFPSALLAFSHFVLCY